MAATDSVMKTLDELKAENAAIEEKAKSTPQVDGDNLDIDVATEETTEPTDDAESAEGEGEKPEVEDWMKSDGHESENDIEPERKYTGGDIGKAKANLKAKLERRHNTETEQLKAQIEELKSNTVSDLNAPKREDFYDDDNPDEAFQDAATDYRINKRFADQDAKNIAVNQETEQARERAELSDAVDKHYDEAAKLVESSGISEAAYQNADGVVRSMIDSVFPDSGDLIADTLMAKLGKGSSKVFYNLGVHQANRAEFEKRLREDKSGFSAAMFLGALNDSLGSPHKKTTSASPPATKIAGDSKPEKPNESKTKYEAAHKKGNFGDAFKLKMQAKAAGADTSDW